MKIGIDLRIVPGVRVLRCVGQTSSYGLVNVQDPRRYPMPRMRIGFDGPTSTAIVMHQTEWSVLQKQTIHGATARSTIQPNNEGGVGVHGQLGKCLLPAVGTIIGGKEPKEQVLVGRVRTSLNMTGIVLGGKRARFKERQIRHLGVFPVELPFDTWVALLCALLLGA